MVYTGDPRRTVTGVQQVLGLVEESDIPASGKGCSVSLSWSTMLPTVVPTTIKTPTVFHNDNLLSERVRQRRKRET